MRPDTQLDYAIFQLTPTRTRCELLVAAEGLTYKLASGLFKPFVAHLHAAEEQLGRGGYSIRLEPPDPNTASWFTKGTMERFVRFVSTPEVLERVSTIGDELTELEQTINLQTNDANDANGHVQVYDHLNKIFPSSFSAGEKFSASASLEKPVVPPTKRESLDGVENGVEENSKQRLLRALDARRLMLQKEQGMAFARAIAAGFSIEHIGDLVVFAECFGANRLRVACIKFMGLCKKRQEAGLWLQDLALAAAQAKSAHTEMAFTGGAGENGSPNEGRLFVGEEGTEKLSRQGSLEDPTVDYWPSASSMRPGNGSGMMGDFNGEYSPQTWARNRTTSLGGRSQLTPEEMHAGMGFYEEPMGSAEYRDSESGRAHGVVRGHPLMAPWQGQPQNQYIQNASPHSPHGAVHTSVHGHPESPYGFAGPGRGLPYPPFLGNSYMQPAYADSSAWQVAEANPNWMGRVHPPLPAQYWPGSQGPQLIGREHVDGLMRNDQYSQKGGEPWTPEYAHREEKLESLHDRDADSPGETTRRLPRRSASPSRRSFSPMRKVQIGRSGSRRSGMVVIRNINYIAPNSQNRSSKEDNGVDSSGSWSDDGDSGANDQDESWQSKTGNMKVSDVIGLFENKKSDSNDPSKKENGKSSSNKSVLRRWTDAGDLRGEDDKDDVDLDKGEKVARNRKHLFNEEAIHFPDRGRQKSVSAESESQAVDLLQRAYERRQRAEEEKVGETDRACGEGMLMLRDRETSNRSTHLRSTEELAEQQGQVSKKKPLVDDSFIVSDRDGYRDTGTAGDGRTIDPDFELVNRSHRDSKQQPGDRRSSDDSFFVLNRSGAQEGSNIGWRMPLNLESEMPCENHLDKVARTSDSFEPDDLMMMPERGKDAVNRSWNTAIDYEMQLSIANMVEDGQHEQGGVDGSELPLESGVQEEEKGGKSKGKGSKMSEREAKAKAMKDMLEKRRSATGKDKPSQLAEAQQRAERLRAYKADLQKSKKEKEEEERKRIEDLRTQRRERIAARSSPSPGGAGAGAGAAAALRSRPPPPLLAVSKSSPTSSSRSKSAGLLRQSAPAPAALLLRASPKPPASARHPLTRSVPSLSPSPNPAPSLRSSTSTALPRFPRTNLDNTSALKANGRLPDAKPPTVRKGIPPAAKDAIAKDGSRLLKPPKTLPSTQQKTAARVAKPPPQKRTAAAASRPAVVPSQQLATEVKEIDHVAIDAPPPSSLPQRNETEFDKQRTTIQPIKTDDSPSIDAEQRAEPENGYAYVRAPASTEIGSVNASVEGLSSTSNRTIAADEPIKILEEPKEDPSIQNANVRFSIPHNSQSAETSPHAQSRADSVDGHLDLKEGDGSPDYHAPIAHVSSHETNLAIDLEPDVNDKDGPTSPPATSISGPSSTEQYDPPFARLTESPIVTPSATLPYQEATRQVPLAETTPVQTETARSRKKWADSGSQKSSKGFKRLLLLGRKSNRSPAQNSSDWVSASTTSEGDEDGEEIRDLPSRNAKSLGFGASIDSTSFSGQASSDPVQSHFKPQADINFASSSTKASRSFFSLSTFRSKGSEGKTLG